MKRIFDKDRPGAIYGFVLLLLHTVKQDYLDTSAGAITACGLIEIAKVVPEYEKKLYLKAAIEILKAIEKDHCDFTAERESIVQNAMGYYKKGEQVAYTFGDYYFVEAFFKLKGFELLPW